MLFNSIDFGFFVPIVWALYWFACQRNIRIQNILLLLASYVFYGWWDWRFLSLIFISTVVDFIAATAMARTEKKQHRKYLLGLSLFVNLGMLGFFKYYNFFIENFISAFHFFGAEIGASTLHLILPVGISFYTFQTLSYTIDVYRKKIAPTNDFIAFAAFVSFFPQLVAGPIERASNLLPQFFKKRQFNYALAADGLRQILWGLFKKIVIADNSAHFANLIFNNSEMQNGSTLVLGALFFTFQIYGDFSGYSDIAIGTARLFGFDLKQNFAFPYFSRNIAEFWRRWHISLSTWFRDYVYIPLGGSRISQSRTIINVSILFLVSGLWHGANWTFLCWGALNALYFIPNLLHKRNRTFLEPVAENRYLPSLKETVQILSTFVLTVLAWVFFRAENVGQAMAIFGSIFSSSLFEIPSVAGGLASAKFLVFYIFFFMVIEWFGRMNLHALECLGARWPRAIRYAFYYFLLASIYWFAGAEQQFIYFQF